MKKKIRRLRKGMKRQIIKNILTVLAFSFTFFLILISFYNECSYFAIFPLAFQSEKCRGEHFIEKLNVTVFGSKIVRLEETGATEEDKGSFDNNTLMKYGNSSSLIHDSERNLDDIPELPPDLKFTQRKEKAEKICTDLMNMFFGKESTAAVDPDETTELPLSVNLPPPPLRRANNKQRPFYNPTLLRVLKSDDKSLNERARYLRSAVAIKKNRWIYFHKIIQSQISPAHNKVVELKWCPIFKAASTPWLAVFTKLAKGLTNSTESQIKRGKLGFMELARTFRLLTPRIYDKTIHVTKYSMVVVRHPFKRLLSAYRDKIERVKGRLYYYNKYSTKIISKFRKPNVVNGAEDKKPKSNTDMKIPTFEEFVRYVLSTDARKLDEHWRPMFLDCNPCRTTFDFILKVETLNDDKQKVLQRLHLTPSDPQYKEVEDVWVRWNNPSGINSPKRNESFYYSQLTIQDIQKLYNLYEPDFRIFDYSPDSYFQMGRPVIPATDLLI